MVTTTPMMQAYCTEYLLEVGKIDEINGCLGVGLQGRGGDDTSDPLHHLAAHMILGENLSDRQLRMTVLTCSTSLLSLALA